MATFLFFVFRMEKKSLEYATNHRYIDCVWAKSRARSKINTWSLEHTHTHNHIIRLRTLARTNTHTQNLWLLLPNGDSAVSYACARHKRGDYFMSILGTEENSMFSTHERLTVCAGYYVTCWSLCAVFMTQNSIKYAHNLMENDENTTAHHQQQRTSKAIRSPIYLRL